MNLNNYALRSWVLKFYSLSLDDQEKIKLNLSKSERQKLDDLLAQIKALGLDTNSSLIDEIVQGDINNHDLYPILFEKMVEVISPFWCVLIGNKLFSDVSLSKKPFYFEEYLNYREHLKGFVLAPKMQTTLDAYFSEKVINECEK